MGKNRLPHWIDVGIHLRRNGATIDQIAAECKVKRTQVVYHLKAELGRAEYDRLCLSNRTPETHERSDEIRERLIIGDAPMDIAKDLGITVGYVHNFKNHKLKSFMRKTSEESARQIFNMRWWKKRGHSEPPEDFDTVDTRI